MRPAKHGTTRLASGVDSDKPDNPVAHLQHINFPDERLNPKQLEAMLSEQVGQPISLLPNRTRVSELASLDQFLQQH